MFRLGRLGIDFTNLLISLPFLIIFGLMGLKIPTDNLRNKLLYSAIEFAILGINISLVKYNGLLPFLGSVIVMRACLMFNKTGQKIVAGIVYLSFLFLTFTKPHIIPRSRGRINSIPPELLQSHQNDIFMMKIFISIAFGLILIFILLLIDAILAERKIYRELRLANEKLRNYALRIEDQATLQERNRIAREIHDSLGHTLTARSIQLENAITFLPMEAVKTAEFLKESKQLCSRALQEVRKSIATLRSNPIQGQSINTILTKLIEDFHQTTGIEVIYKLAFRENISPDILMAIYRIIQESFTNITKHSKGTEVLLNITENNQQICLDIQDNGCGFNPEINTTGFGLQGMRERTIALGGSFSLITKPNQGCKIVISIPLI